MSPISLSISLPVIAASLLMKASLLLVAAAVIDLALRTRSSAAARHLLWTLAIAGLLLLPALSAGLPRWSVLPLPTGWATTGTATSRDLAQPLTAQPASQQSALMQSAARRPGAGQPADAPRRGGAQGVAERPDGVTPAASAVRAVAPAATSAASVIASTATRTAASASAATRTLTGEAAPTVANDASDAGIVGGDAPAGASGSAPQAGRIRWIPLLLTLYAAGALLLLARLAVQLRTVRRLARQAVEVEDPEWTRLFAECAGSLRLERPVRLLRSRERSMPMTFGTRRPVILLPAIADTWSDDRRRAVLLHELAHVARFDCLTQTLATLTCALYWMHPGAWWVARRLRVERELACDDRVLTAGTRARDYAGHLLEIAYSLGGGRAPALVVTMARPRQLEGRMLAVLDDTRNRALPPPRSRLVAIALTATLLLPLAALEGTDASTAATVAGTDSASLQAAQRSELNQLAPQQRSHSQRAGAERLGSLPSDAQTLDAQRADSRAASPSAASPSAASQSAASQLAGSQSAASQSAASGLQTDASAAPVTSQDKTQPLAEGKPARLPKQLVSWRSPGAAFFSTLASKAFAALTGEDGNGVAATGAQERADGRQPGTWEIRPTTDTAAQPGMVYLRLTEMSKDGGGHWSSGTTVPLARLEGLTQAQLAGAGGPVTFRIRRDAGTFTFEGVFRASVGAGTYSFAPDPSFPDQLVKRGLGRPSADQQYDLARMDVGIAFLDELTAQGYQRPEIADLVRAAQHGVSLDYLHEMGSFGYRLGLLDPLIRMRDHGVTARFIRELANDGFTHLSPEDLVRIRDHGVNAEYLSALRDAGYRSVSLEQAINARDHGISREYLHEMAEMGFSKLPLEELIKMRDHGVSAEYARNMKALGYPMTLDEMVKARDHGVTDNYVREMTAAGFGKLSLDELLDARNHGVTADYARQMKELGYQASLGDLINARNHGVTPDYARQMEAAGYGKLPLDALIRTRDHGVTPDYASSLKSLGYDRIALDDLIDLRDHGVTADRIRRANSRAGTRLPLDMIKSLADGGMR